MTTQEIATQLTQLCREGKYDEVYELFFTEETLSIEPEGNPFGTVKGVKAIKEKGAQWNEQLEELYSSEVSDPIVAGDYFTCSMKVSLKLKGTEHRTNTEEICLYKVENGKIVSEQFFSTSM